jgi:hypothetical protein
MKIRFDNKYVLCDQASRSIIISASNNLKLCGKFVKAHDVYNLATVDETNRISPYRKYVLSYSSTFVAFKHDIYNEYMIEVSVKPE